MKSIARLLLAAIASIGFLSACGGSSSSPVEPPPNTDLSWNQGDWDELNWQ